MAISIILPTKWGTDLPAWSIALVAFFFLVWVYGCYKREIATSSRIAKSFLAILRLIIVAILLAVLCEPILQVTRGETHKPAVIVLLDTSGSMGFEDDYHDHEDAEPIRKLMKRAEDDDKITRMDIANELLSMSILGEYGRESHLCMYRFDREIAAASPSEKFEATEELTNIYDNLVKAVNKTLTGLASKKISAVFLITDGQQNTGRQSWQQAADYAWQKKIPVYPIGIGTGANKQDVIVSGIKANSLALAGDKVEFRVEMRNVGYEGQSVKLYLKHGDVPLEEKSVTLGKEGVAQEVILYHTFERKLEEAKDYRLTIVVPTQPKEFTGRNNERHHNIRILPQKFRILYLEELPRWEYRYLKNSLIRDSSIQANMWLFSADEEFPQDKSKDAPELTAVPRGEELFKYDCVILGDVPPERLEGIMPNLVEFVKVKGGGIIFVAGSMNDPGRYWDTPLAELLPISENDAVEEERSGNVEQHLALTEIGKRHNIMKLLPDAKDNQSLWEEELAGFYWYFPVHKEKPGASVLAVHRATGDRIMVTRTASGEGNTFFTALDESWRWRRLSGDVYFDRFWGQVIRYISMSKLVGVGRKYYLRVHNKYCSVNDVVEIELEIRDMKPREKVDTRTIFYKIGEEDKKEMVLHFNPEFQRYESKFVPKRSGVYKLYFTTEDGEEVSEIFQVIALAAEMEKTSLNLEDLQNLARKTKGEYVKPCDLEQFLSDNFSKLTEEKTIHSYFEERPLWDNAWIFLLIVFLLAVEWVVRKIVRLL